MKLCLLGVGGKLKKSNCPQNVGEGEGKFEKVCQKLSISALFSKIWSRKPAKQKLPWEPNKT